MIKAVVSDFSRVLLSPIDDDYTGGLNDLHKELSASGTYDFWSYFQVNQDLLAFFQTIGERVDIYMFTTEYIQEHPALQPSLAGIFKNIFSGARLGLKKSDPQAYETIAENIGLKPEEILYIDDKQANLDVAKQAGLNVALFQTNNQIIPYIGKSL